ncbi:MAG: serine/threonine-protein phosphatase [Phycisphaerae bacterium]|nr:serine/threonine-protein phosphatase [Phycisphaerae bacterium]
MVSEIVDRTRREFVSNGAPDANPNSVPSGVALACMEIWGGNRAVETALSVPGIDAWILSQPYREADSGGDIHYVSMCAAGRIARFALADVSGHGAGVGPLALGVRALMRRNINTLDQTRLARALNESFKELDPRGRFATALLATYFTPSDHLVLCNAGHPPPLLYRAAARTWEYLTPDSEGVSGRGDELPGASNLPLGVIDPTEYAQFAVELATGDVAILYTDALLEAAAAGPGPKRLLGTAGLLEIVRGMGAGNASDLGRELVRRVDAHAGVTSPRQRDDDLTVVVLRHNAGEPPRQGLVERIRITARMLGLS